jgi:hypothetical protein
MQQLQISLDSSRLGTLGVSRTGEEEEEEEEEGVALRTENGVMEG